MTEKTDSEQGSDYDKDNIAKNDKMNTNNSVSDIDDNDYDEDDEDVKHFKSFY